MYGLTGATFGPQAARGFGPRAALRVGWTNVPHALEMTAHAGILHPFGSAERVAESVGERVQIAVDGDVFGGITVPVHDSLYVHPESRGEPFAAGGPYPTFGLTVGAGVTF
jgi:hypothetical protein